MSNQSKLLKFAGKGGIDEKAIAELKKEWKKWTIKVLKKEDFKIKNKIALKKLIEHLKLNQN